MFFIVLSFLLTVLYFYFVRNHDYWAKRNVKHDRPIPLFGNHLQNQLGKKSITEISVELYKKYPKEKVVGYYRGITPELIIKDLELIKKILTEDFLYFYKRGIGRNPEKEPLMVNTFHAEGDKWNLLRKRLSPAFTVAKLKAMFPLIERCTEKLQAIVQTLAEQKVTYDARELMARYATEFVGVCGFGIEMDTINNEHSQFREIGKKIFDRKFKNRLLLCAYELFPELRNFIRVDENTVENAIKVIVEQIRKQRNNKPIGRNDFIDLLLELETKGTMVGESIERVNSDGSPVSVEMEMDFMCQIAQVFAFFAAGFETSSSTTSFCLHILAFNQDTQRKIQEEIDTVMAKYNNRLCYDAIIEMTYLEMAFKEAMRMFPSLGVLPRVCTRRYEIPELDVTIDPGVQILIPVQAIHMDEQYYNNPTKFRPERFTPEAEKERHHYAYLAFGRGPRACIGARLGLVQSLAGLAAVLHKFTVKPANVSNRDLKINPFANVIQSTVGGLPLQFNLRSA